jgi:PhnB protein
MGITQLNPYLNFNGTAGQAIDLYERALGAKTEHLSRFGEAPGMNPSPEEKDRVMHASLKVGTGVIMISDTMPGQPSAEGSNNYVCLNFDEPQDMTTKFNALAEGGTVLQPLVDTFWGAKFGMLTDKFGIRWMFNCTLEKGQAQA